MTMLSPAQIDALEELGIDIAGLVCVTRAESSRLKRTNVHVVYADEHHIVFVGESAADEERVLYFIGAEKTVPLARFRGVSVYECVGLEDLAVDENPS